MKDNALDKRWYNSIQNLKRPRRFWGTKSDKSTWWKDAKVLAIDGLGGKLEINQTTQENGNLTEINDRIYI